MVTGSQNVLAVLRGQAAHDGQYDIILSAVAPSQQVHKDLLAGGSLPRGNGLVPVANLLADRLQKLVLLLQLHVLPIPSDP
jgi:hypothetical protein